MQAGRTLHLACIKQALSEGRVGLNSILTHRLRPGRLFEQRTRLRLRCGMENALQWKEEMTSALADRIIGGGDLGNFERGCSKCLGFFGVCISLLEKF